MLNRKKENYGFTLIEVIIAITIVGALAMLAIPKITIAIEGMRAAEGEQFLYALLAAQKRFSIDNDDGNPVTTDYANNLAALNMDQNMPPRNFNVPVALDANPLAQIIRTGGLYTLYMREDGVVACNCGGGVCADNICQKMGYALQP
jgi:prepilin-type N-terminal cleavage/methylation domain-containing protein